jgi:hypothetical protein
MSEQLIEIQRGPEILIPKKNVVLDATLLTALMTCGRFADLNFNRRFQPLKGKSNSLECGSIVHKGLEIYYKSIINGMKKVDAVSYGMAAAELYIQGCRYCTDFMPHSCECVKPVAAGSEVLVPIANCPNCAGKGFIEKPKCGHPINEFPGVKNTPQEAQKSYEVGWQWVLQSLEQYFEFYRNDFWVPLEVEVVKSKILYEDDEIRILWKAKLDWVADTNQAIYPIDHKTMKRDYNTIKLNNQFIGQCHIMETRNMIINKIGFQKTLEPKEKFEREMKSYPSDILLEWQQETLPYWAKMMLMWTELGFFPANHTNCDNKFGRCKYYDVCEAERDRREEILQRDFMIGPEWNPSNLEDGEV